MTAVTVAEAGGGGGETSFRRLPEGGASDRLEAPNGRNLGNGADVCRRRARLAGARGGTTEAPTPATSQPNPGVYLNSEDLPYNGIASRPACPQATDLCLIGVYCSLSRPPEYSVYFHYVPVCHCAYYV